MKAKKKLSPLILRTPQKLQKWRSAVDGKSVGFVPTMGALHDGHLSLVAASLKKNDLTLVSIYVNPLQFSPSEDFSKYPRNFDRDFGMLAAAGVDAVFAPSSEFKISNHEIAVHHSRLSAMHEGRSRPHFFDGVLTVVLKLLLLARPGEVYFGKKDYQQWRMIEQMVEELQLPCKVRALATRREASGLALSSRNAYFSQQELHIASNIYRALTEARRSIKTKIKDKKPTKAKKQSSVSSLTFNEVEQVLWQCQKQFLSDKRLTVDYFTAVDRKTLKEFSQKKRGKKTMEDADDHPCVEMGKTVLLLAVYVKLAMRRRSSERIPQKVRLIDNIEV